MKTKNVVLVKHKYKEKCGRVWATYAQTKEEYLEWLDHLSSSDDNWVKHQRWLFQELGYNGANELSIHDVDFFNPKFHLKKPNEEIKQELASSLRLMGWDIVN